MNECRDADEVENGGGAALTLLVKPKFRQLFLFHYIKIHNASEANALQLFHHLPFFSKFNRMLRALSAQNRFVRRKNKRMPNAVSGFSPH